MTDWSSKSLRELQENFLADSTNAMPIAGMICWAGLGFAALFLPEATIGQGALYIMMAVLPLAWLIERTRGRNLFAGGDDPMTRLFLTSVLGIAIVVPIAVIAANAAGEPLLVVLAMAVLVGAIWIPYGWAANDPVGLRRAVGQAIGCYAAYALVPAPFTASAICGVVVIGYVYVLLAAKRMGPQT